MLRGQKSYSKMYSKTVIRVIRTNTEPAGDGSVQSRVQKSSPAPLLRVLLGAFVAFSIRNDRNSRMLHTRMNTARLALG